MNYDPDAERMFPCDGLWIVTKDGSSATNIARLGDLAALNAPSLAEMGKYKEEAVQAVVKEWNKSGLSVDQLVKIVIHEIAKHHKSQNDFANDLFLDNL